MLTKLRRNLTRPRMILLLLLTLTSAGCLQAKMPLKPIRPVIQAVQIGDHTCFYGPDAYLLFNYILDLEKGYE